jgi:hypothetical protein
VISVEKPGSPAEILEHHGVKGQKWGVRSNKSTSFRKQFPTSKERTVEIKRARATTLKSERKIMEEPSKAKRDKLYASYLKNPDRATALRMTRGEKFAVSILAVGLPGPGTAAAIGYTGTTVAMRKGTEAAIRRRVRKG